LEQIKPKQKLHFWPVRVHVRRLCLYSGSDLTNPVRQMVASNILISGTSYFSDPQWTNYSSRFHRITAS